MNFINWLGLEVMFEFFNVYLLFPLAFFVIVSIYQSQHKQHYKIVGILLTIVLLTGALLLEDRNKSFR